MIPTTVIEMIVDRQHVGASHRSVIKAMVRGLNHGHKSWIKMPKRSRKAWMRHAIKTHESNRKTYRHVMGGIR